MVNRPALNLYSLNKYEIGTLISLYLIANRPPMDLICWCRGREEMNPFNRFKDKSPLTDTQT